MKYLNVKDKEVHIILFYCYLLLLFGCTQNSKQKTATNLLVKDSIVFLVKASKSKKHTNALKLELAGKALKMSEEIKGDSLWFAALDRVTILQYRIRDFQAYKKDTEKYLNEAISKKDSLHIAKGSYKLGSYYFRHSEYDNAFENFHIAQVIFGKKGDSIEAGKNLLNMAIIQTNSSDYYGSQETSLTALKYLKNESKKRYTLSVYNNLGIVSNELKLFSDAIRWYEKSLDLATRDQQKISLYNNIGLVYRREKNYKKALHYFSKGLQEVKIDEYLSEKATLLDNVGYTHFLQGKQEALVEIQQAFKLRKQLNSIRGQVVSNLHLGEYYFSNGLILIAKKHFLEALNNSKKIKDIKNTSKALFLLSKTVSNNRYIKRYAEINDSLIAKERLFKYQFASIKLAISERELLNSELQKKLIVKNLNLEKQESNNIFLLIVSLSLILVLILGYYYYRQQKRIQHQRHIIDTLEARSDEKQRLSMHLHDDIASDLLIGLQRADFIQKEINNQGLEKAIIFFDRAYQKMRKISQNLSSKYFGDIPFPKRIDTLCNEYSFNNDIYIKHKGTEDVVWNHIRPMVKESIYSLLQEAINNVFKHANATSIIIKFILKNGNLSITIQDNGTGYNISNISGLGIQHMKKRTEELSGRFTIENRLLETGTIIEILIPNSLVS